VRDFYKEARKLHEKEKYEEALKLYEQGIAAGDEKCWLRGFQFFSPRLELKRAPL
jgi:hypothetical protein